MVMESQLFSFMDLQVIARHGIRSRIFLNNSYQVITIDILGHGKTDSPTDLSRYKIDRVARDIASILDEVGISKAYIAGYSMGGRLALSFAMYYPERVNGLLLESASPGLRSEIERQDRVEKDELLAQMILEKGIEEFVHYWEQIPLFETQRKLSEQVHDQMRKQRLANNTTGLVNSLKEEWEQGVSLLGGMKRFNSNFAVLLLAGELDHKFCSIAKKMEAIIPTAKFVEFTGVGHAIHIEDPEKFGTIVLKYLIAYRGNPPINVSMI